MTAMSEILTGGSLLAAGSAAMAATWRYGKTAATWAASKVVQRSEYGDKLVAPVLTTFISRYGLPRLRTRSYGCAGETKQGNAAGQAWDYVQVAYEDLRGQSFVFWDGWRPILVIDRWPGKAGDAATGSPEASGRVIAPLASAAFQERPAIRSLYSDPRSRTLHVVALRGHLDRDAMAREATNTLDAHFDPDRLRQSKRRFRHARIPSTSDGLSAMGGDIGGDGDWVGAWFRRPDVRLLQHDPATLGWIPTVGSGAIAGMALDRDALAMVDDARRWLASRDWHGERDMPWRRGVALYGRPGTGKTSLARAMAVDLDLPIYTFALNEMTNAEFLSSWDSLRSHVPCIALFEDFDRVFRGREIVSRSPVGDRQEQQGDEDRPVARVKPRDRVQFDAFLNALDGVDRSASNGIMTIITTNEIDHLDPALGGPATAEGPPRPRPGRIDRVLELRCIDAAGREKLARRLARGLPDLLAELLGEVAAGEDGDETPAQYETRVGQRALAAHMLAYELEPLRGTTP